jgi:5-methylcytosine-specific restriction endonuclease McrA
MSVVATALRELMALGVTGEALAAAVERIEEAATIERIHSVREAVESAAARADSELADRKARGQERTRKWRERLEATGLSGEQWRVLSAEVIARDGARCQYCGTSKGRMACDHVTPLLQGGSSSRDNLVCACHTCNAGKSGRTLVEWKGAEWAARWHHERHVTSRDALTCEGAQVVTLSSSSLRSEEGEEPPPTPKGVGAPKGAETARGSRLPEDWHPVPDYNPGAYGLTFEQHEAELAKFRDYWRSVPGAKGRKTDWPATWRNWMRRASENSPRKAHDQPSHDPKYERRQANLARAFASPGRAAGQRWEP